MTNARIKPGSPICQDHRFPRWPFDGADVMTVFKVEHSTGDYVNLRAFGFGVTGKDCSGGSYGNGAIYCRKEYLVFTNDEAYLSEPEEIAIARMKDVIKRYEEFFDQTFATVNYVLTKGENKARSASQWKKYIKSGATL